jgi:hypothetical protein
LRSLREPSRDTATSKPISSRLLFDAETPHTTSSAIHPPSRFQVSRSMGGADRRDRAGSDCHPRPCLERQRYVLRRSDRDGGGPDGCRHEHLDKSNRRINRNAPGNPYSRGGGRCEQRDPCHHGNVNYCADTRRSTGNTGLAGYQCHGACMDANRYAGADGHTQLYSDLCRPDGPRRSDSYRRRMDGYADPHVYLHVHTNGYADAEPYA